MLNIANYNIFGEEYMNPYYIYIIIFITVLLVIYLGVEIHRLLLYVREKKAEMMQAAEAESRQDIEDAIAFLEDETSSKLSEQKKIEFRMAILNKLKKEERANKEIIKKMIMDEVAHQEKEKKKKLEKEAVLLIMKDILSIFRKEFFKKIKKIIVETKKANPKSKQSRSEQNRRQMEEQKRRERERKEKEHSEEERRNTKERKREENEKRIQELKEKERQLEEERKKREKEEKERKEREEKQKKTEQQKQAQKGAAAGKGGR